MKKNLLSIVAMAVLMVISAVGYAQTTYTMVNSASELEPGQYILVGFNNDGEAFAMGYQKTNNRHALTVDNANGVITVEVATSASQQDVPFEFTLEGSAGAWTIFDPLNNGYLCAPGGGNYLKTQANVDDNSTWTISDGDEGGMVPVSLGAAEQNTMRYNITSTLFGCYKASSNVSATVYFFKAGGSVINPEPSNYPTNFAALLVGDEVTLMWNDATGNQLPSKYLVMGSVNGIQAPVDGQPIPNGELVSNVNYGVRSVTFSGLEAFTTYHFAIFPYTNSGENIDYKTDGNYPTTQVITQEIAYLLNEDFESGLGMFTEYSITGEQVWVQAEHNGNSYAYMNGFADGVANENHDWLISPEIPFNREFGVITMEFKSAKNYNGDAIRVMISSDFNGGDPVTDGNWEDITDKFVYSSGSYNWVESGRYNVLEKLTDQLGFFHFAFVYTSANEAAAWEIDDVKVVGGTMAVKEQMASTVSVYPNPAHDMVSFNLKADAKVSVYDVTGRMVSMMNVAAGQGQYQVADLENGVYFLNIRYNDGKTEVARFVKF